MGYRKIPTIYTLNEFEKYPGLEVRFKGLKLGRMRKFISMSEDEAANNVDEILGLVVEGLVSWNLEDENGIPVPTTMEGIDDQELDFVLEIFNAWADKMMGISDDLGKGSTSGVTSPVPLPTMEAL